MVLLDQNQVHITHRPRLTLPLLLALAALALGFAGLAARGFDAAGMRFGAQLIWRFDAFVLFAALAARPAGQFIAPLRPLADKGRPLLQGFAAVMGVFFAFLLVSGLSAMPDGVASWGVTAGMTAFILFTGAVTLVLWASLSRRFCEAVGVRACRAMTGMAVVYFWLCYVLLGVALSSGQGGPSLFHSASVIFLLAALIARIAGRFFTVRNRTMA